MRGARCVVQVHIYTIKKLSGSSRAFNRIGVLKNLESYLHSYIYFILINQIIH